MIKDFFIKKENILMLLIACLSLIGIVIGFSFLFFKSNSTQGPRVIPNTIEQITWGTFSSDIFDLDIIYPDYMYIIEQRESNGVGITISEFVPREFLTYFSNQNHISIYPDGIDNQLFYGKTRQSLYTSQSGQVYNRIEYLTVDNDIWGILLTPQKPPKGWQPRGFIWIQSAISNKEFLCISKKGILINNVVCDPYAGELPVYRGDISNQFINFGYETINKNSF